MNLYIIPAWYPENENDLTASFIREQAHALSNRDHTITVLFVKVFSFRQIKEYLKYRNRIWKDDKVIAKYYKKLVFLPCRFEKAHHKLVSSKYYKIIKHSIIEDIKNKRGKPDLIHAHVGPWCAYFVIPAAKKLGLPIVTTEHYSGLTNGNKNAAKFVREKYVIENSDLTIFVSSNFQKYVLETTGAKGNTIVIPNQINVENFKCVKSEKDGKTFKFITACHLVSRKKVDLVVKAFHEEFKKDDNVEYVIAGDGPERKQLELLVDELKENGRIHFTGKYSREDMPKLFSDCDAFVLVSEYEPFGIVYIEAMMCGLPCIGTQGQGSDDIISELNGLQVEFGNLVQLKKSMRQMFENIDSYNIESIVADTAFRFSEKNICRKIEESYIDLLNVKFKKSIYSDMI